ncbi:MAG: hypothetical protein REI95_05770 [Oxalicibacterium faecigallinarum]|nr:hypothetical protein [Oxalicibacterium faecigallinarum]MDQ7969134.1 hypothetical protein [Oxalicibacterium faecigallinarum]
MKFVTGLFRSMHVLTAVFFAMAALMLIIIAVRMGWQAFGGELDSSAAQSIIEAVGLLAAAVVALQIAETIVEEEVVRDADISAPTRVRRFLSRFFVVVVVALAIEGLVATFKAIHDDMAHLPYAASILASTALLLTAWGAFVYFNRSAEELEPEAMQEAKGEDSKLQ